MKNLDMIGAEIYAILSNVSIEKYNKIPTKITKIFEKYKEYAKNVIIKPNIEFDKQEISKEAKDIMFVIALNYWLTGEEKKKVINTMSLNEEKLKEKYNIEKIFEQRKNLQINSENEETVAIIEKKESFFTKIIKFIKSFFINKKNKSF